MADHKIVLNDVTLACDDRGAGMPVVLLHGFPLDRHMWAGQIERLASEFRVIAPDLRGFGGSLLADGDVDAGVAMDRYMADVWAALDALGATDPVVLVGFSMGGYAAWQGALRTPQRLRGLVLCDTRAVGDSAEAAAGREKLAAAVLAAGDASPALAMLPKLLSAETQERRPDVVAETTAMIERQSPEAIAAALRGMARRDDVRSRLAEIACPCLAIVGSADVISPPDEMRSIVEALPDARLVEAPAGHMAPMENAEAVTEALLEFARARCREA